MLVALRTKASATRIRSASDKFKFCKQNDHDWVPSVKVHDFPISVIVAGKVEGQFRCKRTVCIWLFLGYAGIRGQFASDPGLRASLPAFKPDHQRLEPAHKRQPENKQQKKHKAFPPF